METWIILEPQYCKLDLYGGPHPCNSSPYPPLPEFQAPRIVHLGFSFGERANGTSAYEVISSEQDRLPRLTWFAVKTFVVDICKEDLLGGEDITQSIDSEFSRYGVRREFCIWGARMVEFRGPQPDSGLIANDAECVRAEYGQ